MEREYPPVQRPNRRETKTLNIRYKSGAEGDRDGANHVRYPTYDATAAKIRPQERQRIGTATARARDQSKKTKRPYGM